MNPVKWHRPHRLAFSTLACCGAVLFAANRAGAGGVTIITHGLNGDTDGWVNGMATNLPNYYRFQGTNFTGYKMYFYASNSAYYLAASRVSGSPAYEPASGEIIIKLDWGNLADGNSYDTYQIASAVAPALLSANFIPELGGHALAEFPLHLIGHSRGGSLVCELSRRLGTNGIWVDHLTTLDPHPLNDPAFPWDFIYDAVDAPANTYENVLFHDNDWQDSSWPVFGKPVAGAYVRKLRSFGGGYSGLGSQHSDVHLWYHGTLDWRVPASDTEATLTSAERSSWWTAYEASGAVAGFVYSLIGGADRTSTDQPDGAGFGMIRDGFNQKWDLGAGTANNRTALATNNGSWPSLIKFNRATTNSVVQGQALPVTFYYQWAQPDTYFATIRIYLDDDLNALNTNQTLLREIFVPGNGAAYVSYATTNLLLDAANASPGWHAVLATIAGGGRERHLYAPELVEVIPSRQPPTLDLIKLDATRFVVGVNGLVGQTIVLQVSTDLQAWSALATNTLATSRWTYTNQPAGTPAEQFYRAVLP